MNGREVQLWAGLGGFPNKILPGGYVMGTTGTRPGKKAYQDQIDLVQVDWDGNIVWKFDKTRADRGRRQRSGYMARQHHDFQREGSTGRILLSGRGAEDRQWKYIDPDT